MLASLTQGYLNSIIEICLRLNVQTGKSDDQEGKKISIANIRVHHEPVLIPSDRHAALAECYFSGDFCNRELGCEHLPSCYLTTRGVTSTDFTFSETSVDISYKNISAYLQYNLLSALTILPIKATGASHEFIEPPALESRAVSRNDIRVLPSDGMKDEEFQRDAELFHSLPNTNRVTNSVTTVKNAIRGRHPPGTFIQTAAAIDLAAAHLAATPRDAATPASATATPCHDGSPQTRSSTPFSLQDQLPRHKHVVLGQNEAIQEKCWSELCTHHEKLAHEEAEKEEAKRKKAAQEEKMLEEAAQKRLAEEPSSILKRQEFERAIKEKFAKQKEKK